MTGGRIALVCASTGGLGEAVARGLAARGDRVVITGRRADRAEAIAAELPGAVAIPADLTADGEVDRVVAHTQAELGAPEVLVLNGPGPRPGTAEALDGAAATAAVHDLFLVQQQLVSLVLPAMLEAGRGRIVAIGSSGVETPLPGLAASNVGRWALAAYLKTLAGEVAARGVTVNLVLPGRIATDRVAQLDRGRAASSGRSVEEEQARSVAQIPAGRYGTPEEFAAAAVFLASPEASYITGTALRCDGGLVGTL